MDSTLLDQHSLMSDELLAKIGYEKTPRGVRKKMMKVKSNTHKLTQLDLSPRAILERECLSTSIEDLNKYLNLGEHSFVTIRDDVYKDENIHMMVGEDRVLKIKDADLICIGGMDSDGNIVDIIFHVLYHLRDGETVDIFNGEDNSIVLSTSLLRDKTFIHKRITEDELNALDTRDLGDYFNDDKIFQTEEGDYYWNGYEVTDELEF